MEIPSGQPEQHEQHEQLVHQPQYLIFLGRHAEPAKKSIFDQVGGEVGIKSDNFEESSLTLKGIIDSSMLDRDLMTEISRQMPTGRIKIILGNTGAYRTRETAQLIKEKLEAEAKKLEREIYVEIEGPDKDELLTETREESEEKSTADIKKLVESIRGKSSEFGGGLAYFGITHDAKLSNFLNNSGIATDGVETSELLTIADEGDGKNQVLFRGQAAELNIEPEQAD
jgi:flavodoxin